MPTKKQLAANRKNARRFTGPTSTEGKAISSQTALKTGLDATFVVVPFEDPDQYLALSNAAYGLFAPTTRHERCLVDMLITSQWLRRRYLSVEAGIYRTQFECDNNECDNNRKPSRANVDRRLNSALRSYTRTLKQLVAVHSNQSKKQTHFELESSLQLTVTKPVNPELGSFLISVEKESLEPKRTPEQTTEVNEMVDSKKQTQFEPKKPLHIEQPPEPIAGVTGINEITHSKKQTHFHPRNTLHITAIKPVNKEFSPSIIWPGTGSCAPESTSEPLAA